MSELGMKEQAVLSCRDLGKAYEEGPESVVVLSGLQLELHPGERVAIVGTSGSGKSTLLNLLGGLDTPTTGSVWLAGEELSALGEKARGLLRNRWLAAGRLRIPIDRVLPLGEAGGVPALLARIGRSVL